MGSDYVGECERGFGHVQGMNMNGLVEFQGLINRNRNRFVSDGVTGGR